MKILLLCVGGLSTSSIAAKLTELAKKDDIEFLAMSILDSRWQEIMNDYDHFMVSPQTAFRYDFVAKEVKDYGRGQKVYQMKQQNYIISKAEVILDEVKKYISS